jgi:hypothetical protein
MPLSHQGLAEIDRQLLSELDHGEGVQLVKVPVSNAVWSTWRRYCEAVGISMGRAVALLLHRELGSVPDEDIQRAKDLLRDRESNLVAREEALVDRERNLEDRERRLAGDERHLAARLSSSVTPRRGTALPPRQGRNQLCACGSGKKFKYCHRKS